MKMLKISINLFVAYKLQLDCNLLLIYSFDFKFQLTSIIRAIFIQHPKRSYENYHLKIEWELGGFIQYS